MGIVRGVAIDKVEPLIECVISAGLKTMEITMNTPEAVSIIKKAVEVSSGRVDVGAGTVLSVRDMRTALDAGASFIVMPVYIKDIVGLCVKEGTPVFPGALTPQEVFTAWEAGPSMVKVFPASVLGPRYLKELKGPFDKMKLMAVGGVRPDNVEEYFSNGADAAAFGGSVFSKELLANDDFDTIRENVSLLVEEVKKHHKR